MGSSRIPRAGPSVFTRSTWLDASVEAVFAFHENPRNLEKISPRPLRVVRIEAEPTARVGGRFRVVARQFAVPIDWTGEWREVEPPAGPASSARLADRAVRAPFALFDHEHHFAPENGGTRMTDRVTYALLGPQWGAAGRLANWFVARLVLGPMFRARHTATRRWFAAD